MKKLMMILAAAVVTTGAAAQDYLLDNPDNRAYFGARVGLDVSSTGGAPSADYCSSLGFSIGAIYNIPLWKNLYFEPGLHAFYDTFGERVTVGLGGNDDQGPLPYQATGSIRNFGFRIPFNFGYRFDFTEDISVSVYTGPVLNVNLVAYQHFNNLEVNGMVEDMSDLNGSVFGTGGFKRFDLQWQFGVGCSWQQYYVTIGGGVGMTNVFDGPLDDKVYDDSFRRNTFNLAIGYNF